MVDLDKICSPAVCEAIGIAIAAGHTVKVISSEWEVKWAVFMELSLEPDTVTTIKSRWPQLVHSEVAATPHNAATECFLDAANEVVLVFPARGEGRRWY